MKTFLFSCGNSSDSRVSLHIRVRAKTARVALAYLNATKDVIQVDADPFVGDPSNRIEHCTVYINASAITIDDLIEESD